jgi:hypothetical protein
VTACLWQRFLLGKRIILLLNKMGEPPLACIAAYLRSSSLWCDPLAADMQCVSALVANTTVLLYTCMHGQQPETTAVHCTDVLLHRCCGSDAINYVMLGCGHALAPPHAACLPVLHYHPHLVTFCAVQTWCRAKLGRPG